MKKLVTIIVTSNSSLLRLKIFVGFASLLATTFALSTRGIAAEPLQRFPTVSNTNFALVASGNLWLAPKDGGLAHSLTGGTGQVLSPHFSPNGDSIAFTWRRAGANDVFIVPTTGGVPVQLTHGPSTGAYDNLVTGWSPDGRNVLFLSHRAAALRKHFETFIVKVTGGLATPLGIDHSGLSSMSPDGSQIAYDWSFRNLGGDYWKRYRGGQAGEIFIYDLHRNKLSRLTDWAGTDTAPMWWQNRIYFLSDRGPEGRLNIWSIDLDSKKTRQITHFKDYDIDMPSIGPGGLAFQEGGRLHLIDLPSETVHDIQISTSELAKQSQTTVDGTRFIRLMDIASRPDFAAGDASGTGYISAHGDLFALRSSSTPTNLTHTSGIDEDHPAVSPDGADLAYTTDVEGEQEVAILHLNAPERPRIVTHFKSGVLYTPHWSPDGKSLMVTDTNKQLWLVNIKSTRAELIAHDPYGEIHDAAFSTNGQIIAYSTMRSNGNRTIHLRYLSTGKDIVLSSPLESDHDPAFTNDGKSILFVSARRESPFVSDRDREGTIATIGSDGLYLATVPRQDQDGAMIYQTSARTVNTKLSGGISNLIMKDNTLFYLETGLSTIEGNLPGQFSQLHSLSVKTRTDQVLARGADGYSLSPDGGTIFIANGDDLTQVKIRDGQQNQTKPVDLSLIKVELDPVANHREMFEETWRFDRDLFWDPKLNGVNWSMIHDRYARLVDRTRSQEDMIYLLGEMQGELSASHMFIIPGPTVANDRPSTTALLGVDFTLDPASGRYRMAHVYRGDGTRDRFRAPLGDPALDIQDGDFLLAVDGAPLRAPDDPYRLLMNKTGPLEITVSHTSNGPARAVQVVPVKDESEIRKLDWIEANRKMVDKLSLHHFGYVYLSDFDEFGAEDFLRQYYGQTIKEGLVIDVRDNLGGFASQWVLGLLRRPQAGIFQNREGAQITLPGAIPPRKLVTITDLFSSSDGDQFPYYFRLWNMGPIVGERTWGGVRGIKGPWPLIDGTSVTIPKDSLLTTNGAQIIENRGAEPSVEIDDNPATRRLGHDAQLEMAVKQLQTGRR